MGKILRAAMWPAGLVALALAAATSPSRAALVPCTFVFLQKDKGLTDGQITDGGTIYGAFEYDAETLAVFNMALAEGADPIAGGETGANIGSTNDLSSFAIYQPPRFDGLNLVGDFNFEGSNAFVDLSVTGTFGPGPFGTVDFDVNDGQIRAHGNGLLLYGLNSLQYPQSPEPASLALLAGFVIVGGRRQRRATGRSAGEN